MIVAAWLCALLLLTLFFNNELEEQYNPNTNPQSKNTVNGAEVKLLRNRHGHYVSTGTINAERVTFLLDTGATDVSIPANLANRLGLEPGAQHLVSTANGQIYVSSTRINELSIGDIRLFNVAANINPGMQGEEILLGMSALKQLEFTQRGDQLTLRQY
ncbi:TIGR02281 family clan AA aspartic protease [Alteromonadaceae bacterium M269]|nr:TIGR02281 family clan AA aspartic protease [Alteromonadaceae bacterium M269]